MEIFASTWSEFKTLVSNKSLKMQYFTFNNKYHIFATEGSVQYRFTIEIESPASSDQTDFEDNYQGTANAAVSAPISGSFTADLPRYRPKLTKFTTDTALDQTTASTLVSITGDGQVDFMSFLFSRDDYEIIVEVDGSEAYTLKGDDEIKDEFELEDAGAYISTEDGRKKYIERWPTPVDFDTSFVIKAKKTTSSSVSALAGLVRWREKIT